MLYMEFNTLACLQSFFRGLDACVHRLQIRIISRHVCKSFLFGFLFRIARLSLSARCDKAAGTVWDTVPTYENIRSRQHTDGMPAKLA